MANKKSNVLYTTYTLEDDRIINDYGLDDGIYRVGVIDYGPEEIVEFTGSRASSNAKKFINSLIV